MLQGPTPSITEWLEHLAGLLGTSAPTVAGTGTNADPWKVELFAVPGGSTNSGLYATLANITSGTTDSLELGLQFQFVPFTPKVQITANAVLASIPLAGDASAKVLPSAAALLQAPGDGSALVNAGGFSIQTFRAGFSFDGANLQPLLELDTVQFDGQTYDKLDLTNVNSVVASASTALRGLLPLCWHRIPSRPSAPFIAVHCLTPRTHGRICSKKLRRWPALQPLPQVPALLPRRGPCKSRRVDR
jgi:hypothetical protein